MEDSDTATVELSKGEAREAINALSSYRTTETGQDERRALNVEEFLQREFGFKDDDTGLSNIGESFASFLDDSDEQSHEVQLSRAEAEEVVEALAAHENDSATDAGTVRDLRTRLAETYELNRSDSGV
ncbi:hypothetical protein C474_11701 [Halogeometricum pallidum JCM 14848]|uniref:Uncharacterized protein n=1 Tax=Halogeometricum pallidum JCM 14848 TaxID=1227487 RepID=M0D4V0_HALPD|nr:hypothetical protein [Halogeometricum pallidum]ELZ30475.1 hypothetical protein C474_11701 [Halogeometricum pallidum JCM 14848]